MVFVESSIFLSNGATLNGGAIFFNKLPFYQTNCSFLDNQAIYGLDNGSYPLRMKLSDATLKNLNDTYYLQNMPSGSVLPVSLEVEICDMYYQKIITSNDGFITINLLNGSTPSIYQDIEGTTVQKVQNGSAIFDHFLLFSDPVNITFYLKFSTALIDENVVNINISMLNLETYEYFIGNSNYMMMIPIHIRACVPGEIYDTNISACSPCPVLSYSFDPSDIKCTECPVISDCFGGMNLSLHPGYWRSGIYSDIFHVCEPYGDSCL